MVECNFYDIGFGNLEKFLAQLSEKILALQKRAVIVLKDEDQVNHLNQQLWTFSTNAFIPHGSKINGDSKNQPIWLTHVLENPNNSSYLVSANIPIAQGIKNFEKYFFIFSKEDKLMLKNAKLQKEKCLIEKIKYSFYHQSEGGKWVAGKDL
jgi:DNA polymerase-3 subunit chi|tara:strand:- start:949 stop:1404 length:456 start_codon:yes stop_codon:yes gene_type:complete